MLRLGFAIILIICTFYACNSIENKKESSPNSKPYITVLGVAQDAGYPQAGCQKDCCKAFWEGKAEQKLVSCIALVDPKSGQKWLFDATPDFKKQLEQLNQLSPSENMLPDGIFLTHAHIGHYTGLMQVGREVMGTKALPVYAMPKMEIFLTKNGPWSQLVALENINIQSLKADSTIQLNERIRVTPFRVPHRDEFSETVGYRIESEERSAIFIPDIDKWEKWERDIKSEIEQVDYAFLDGSFYKNGELPNRDMSEIPHPFVEESMALFENLKHIEKQKVIFIHFNHTNPLLHNSLENQIVLDNGFQVAKQGMVVEL